MAPLEVYYRLGSERGLRWTPLTRQVLEVLHGNTEPLGAYAIRDRLRALGNIRPANSVYRQLAKLIHVKLAIILAAPRAYLISPDPDVSYWLALKCPSCKRVELRPAGPIMAALRARIAQARFKPARIYLEAWADCGCSAELESQLVGA